MSAGFPAENMYAPGDAGMGNPVRFPNDSPIYATNADAGNWLRNNPHKNLILGAALIGGIVLLHEHKRIKGRWIP